MKVVIRVIALVMVVAGSSAVFFYRYSLKFSSGDTALTADNSTADSGQQVSGRPASTGAVIPPALRQLEDEEPAEASAAEEDPLPESSDNDFILPQSEARLACIETPTTALTERTRSAVFSWTDAEGNIHFGDRPPADVAVNELAVRGKPTLEFFSLDINYSGYKVPFLYGKLEDNVTDVFEIVGGMIGRERLRKVELLITILPDEDSFRSYRGYAPGTLVAGYYNPGLNESVTWNHSDSDTTLTVATHESVHVILAGLLGSGYVPLWMNEGLAQYFEKVALRNSESGRLPINWGHIEYMRDRLETNGSISLESFLNKDYDDWQQDKTQNYSYSLVLVYFLMQNEEQRLVMNRLLGFMADRHCQPVDVPGWLAANYSGGIAQMEQDLISWIERIEPMKQ